MLNEFLEIAAVEPSSSDVVSGGGETFTNGHFPLGHFHSYYAHRGHHSWRTAAICVPFSCSWFCATVCDNSSRYNIQVTAVCRILQSKKIKVVHTRLQSVGFRDRSRLLAVSLQVM